MMKTIYVTPSLKAKEKAVQEACHWAQEIGAVFVPRQGRTIEALKDEYGDALLVYTSRGPQIQRAEGIHFFSLNMAELRIQHIRNGQNDHLLEAIGAEGPVRLLDCTCGFGADAITASFALPAGSHIDALEASPLLEAVTEWGCRHFCHERDDVTAALRRIHVRQGNYLDYLADKTAAPYDVLYFDPMFSRPVEGSCQFQPVRPIMNHHPLTVEALQMAVKKARQRVVVKGRDFRGLEQAFPNMKRCGGKYSRIGYAVLDGEA